MSRGEVAIVDLGLGNLRSVARAFERADAKPELVSRADEIARAGRLVVPGQGAFRDAAAALEGGVGEALRAHVGTGKPYLGICLGMQVLFESSEEAAGSSGLALFPGHVARFPDGMRDPETRERLKVPHVGWNVVRGRHALLPHEGWFYFVHSYRCVPASGELTVATADYGGPFCAAVARDNVLACQFHPEKSQAEGARLIERFLAS
jgi:glutamine amidotransferase